jgi:ankyrin repeat protein
MAKRRGRAAGGGGGMTVTAPQPAGVAHDTPERAGEASRLVGAGERPLDAASLDDLNHRLCIWGVRDADNPAEYSLSTITALLDAGADVNARFGLQDTPLHCLAERGVSAASAQALLDAGAAVDAQDMVGRTPLMLAANRGRVSLVRVLLAAGADVGTRDGYDQCALHFAARASGSRETVDALLAAGADAYAVDRGGDTPFSLAAQEGQQHASYALVMHAYPRMRHSGVTLLYGMCRSSEAHECAMLLQGEPGEPVPTLMLFFAALLGKVDALRGALASGADVHAANRVTGQTALHAAAAEDCADCVAALLEAGADAMARDVNGNTPLSIATEAGHAHVVRLLQGSKPHGGVDSKAGTAKRGKAAAAPPPAAPRAGAPAPRIALDDDHILDDEGDADVALFTAKPGGYYDAASGRAIVGAELDEVLRQQMRGLVAADSDGDGLTPLHHAAFGGAEGYARELLREGAAVYAASHGGMTPLMCAARGGHAPMVRLLLAAGADARALEKNGWGVLHFAAIGGSPEAVTALLAAGADAHARDATGTTPFLSRRRTSSASRSTRC